MIKTSKQQERLIQEEAPSANLITMVLKDGTVTRLTSHASSLEVGGAMFTPVEFKVKRRQAAGEADTLHVTFAKGARLPAGLANALESSSVLGARTRLERLFMSTPGDTAVPPIQLFEGRATSVQGGADTIGVQAKGDRVRTIR